LFLEDDVGFKKCLVLLEDVGDMADGYAEELVFE
jgi:hypothetical protein